MQLSEKKSLLKRRKMGRKAGRWLRRHLTIGWGYRITSHLGFVLAMLMAGSVGGIFALLAIISGVKLDINTILSIILADIPVSVFLWFALGQGESEDTLLLKSIEITEAPTRYTRLEVHYSVEYEHGIYPELQYYIVNTKSKRAYWVDGRIQDLIEARIIRKFPKHRDKAQLIRHFEANQYKIAAKYPEGDDLFRDAPPADEV
jgi:hypothetical protein